MKNEGFNKFVTFFRNSKTYFLINIGGLSIAFAVFILIMLFVNNEFNFDKFNTNGDRIYRLEEGEYNQVPMAIPRMADQNFQEIEKSLVIKSLDNHWLSYDKNFFEIEDFCFADNSIFEMFTIPFILGDPKTALEAPYTIVLSESVSKRIFGDKNPIGEKVNFKNQDNYTVTGVIKDLPDFHLPAKAIGSIKSIEARYGLDDNTWGWGLVSYVMLGENQDPGFVEQKLNDLLNENQGWKEGGGVISFRPFNDIYLATDTEGNDETKHGSKTLLLILTVIGIFILLIASINYINLSVSKGLKRVNDFNIRRILGSSKGSIIFSYIINSVKVCVISLVIALAIVLLSLNSYENLIGKELNIESFLNGKNILLFVFGIVALGTVYGFFPAWFLLRANSGQSVKGGLSATKRSGFNVGLITLQYAVSIILICGTIITYKQLDFIRNSDLGLNKEQVVCVELTQTLKNNLSSFKTKLLENPNISGVSFISDNITQLKEYSTLVTIDNERHIFNNAFIDPEFIPLMNIDLLQGDNFSEDMQSQNSGGYMINEAAWEIIQNSALKEQNYTLDNRALVGVIKNFHFESFHNKVNPMIFYWGNSELYNNVLIKLNGNYSESLSYIGETFTTFAPESLCKYHFVDDAFNGLYKSEEVMVKLLGIFSLLAIFIASLGIISLSAMSAETRIKEIGIRKVNGAKVSELLVLLNKDFVKWVVLAFVIATPIAWIIMNSWLNKFVYKTNLSWWIFVLTGVLALGIALITVSWQSWRAATRNPVEALRYE